MKKHKIILAARIWEFDVDNTLIMWRYTRGPLIRLNKRFYTKNMSNILLLEELSNAGWYIRVHSGTGVEWALKVVKALKLLEYVDEICAKPLGRTDDQPVGDGLAYTKYSKE